MTRWDGVAPAATCNGLTSRRDLCGRPAGWGTMHPGYGRCKLHAGASPGGTKAGLKAQAREVAVARLGMSVDVEPFAAQLALIGEAASNVAYYRRRVQEDLGDEVYAETFHANGERTGMAQPHVLVRMYDDERVLLSRLCREAHAMGILERRIQLAQEEGEVLRGFMLAVLARLGLTAEQQMLVPSAVREEILHVIAVEPPGGAEP